MSVLLDDTCDACKKITKLLVVIRWHLPGSGRKGSTLPREATQKRCVECNAKLEADIREAQQDRARELARREEERKKADEKAIAKAEGTKKKPRPKKKGQIYDYQED